MRVKSILILIAITLLLSSKVSAQVIDSSFYQWTVYELEDLEREQKMCYLVAHPIESDTDHSFRDKPYIMITRYADDRTEEITIYSGFEYKIGSEIHVLIGGQEFRFYTKLDKAWAKTPQDDAEIIQRMLRSSTTMVRSDAAIGKYAIDKYSLKGITRAYNRMRQICE